MLRACPSPQPLAPRPSDSFSPSHKGQAPLLALPHSQHTWQLAALHCLRGVIPAPFCLPFASETDFN